MTGIGKATRFVSGLLVTGLLAAPAAARDRDDLRRDMELAKEQVYPALVNISVVVKVFGGGRAGRAPAAGSGVIVSPAGHVVTNYHVAGDTTRIVCRLPTKEAILADVLAHDPLTDLTVLKLRLDARKDKSTPIPFARLGDSDALAVGDHVLAMGNPQSLSSSMTLGIVSNVKRVFTSFTGADLDQLDLGEGQLTGLFTRWIQHDALILPGNSGGPLVNLRGEVVGINELGGGGVGFAIPSNLVSHVLNQALTSGEVRRGWFGFTLYPVEKLGETRGALVASVQRGGPAEQAGLLPGDVVRSIGGVAVDAVHAEEIPLVYKMCADCRIGSRVPVTFLRDGKIEEATIEVARMEPFLADQQEVRRLGITARDITGPMSLVRRYPDAKGVLVTGVRAGHPANAAKPDIRPGDVLVELDGKAVPDFAAFAAQVEALPKREGIALRLRRGREDVVTVLDLSPKPDDFSGGELAKAWIGIETQVVTPEIAKALGLGDARGFRITRVHEETEAHKAGLVVGDIVTALNGQELRAYRPQDAEILTRRVEALSIDDKATFVVRRDGEDRKVDVVLEETPGSTAEAKSATDDVLEYAVRGVTFHDRSRNQWPRDQQGVIVTNVASGGWASLAGLDAGDLILKIDGERVGDVTDFKRVAERIQKEKPAVVRIFVIRGYRTAFVFAEPEY